MTSAPPDPPRLFGDDDFGLHARYRCRCETDQQLVKQIFGTGMRQDVSQRDRPR